MQGRPVSDYILDIQKWTREVLSVPSEELGGQPPCPYAQGAWDAGLVSVGICDGLDDVTDALDFFPLVIVTFLSVCFLMLKDLLLRNSGTTWKQRTKVWWQKICGLWHITRKTIQPNTD